ncbi:MAG: methyltransferase [Acidobacteriota bacterium]
MAGLRSNIDGSAHSAAMLYGESFWWDAWGGLFESVRTGGTAFEQVHGVGFFEFVEANPDAASVFNAAMQSMTAERAAAIAAAIDTSGCRSLVDVGGGHGAFAAAIARCHPAVAVTLFDRPSVVDGARSTLSSLGVLDCCGFVIGDFFVFVPGGADIYTLKDIVHDWDDERALRILTNVRGAMSGSARLLVIERIVPPGGEPSVSKIVDMSMLVLTGGKERTDMEYRALLHSAGLRVRRVTRLDQETSIIEAEAATR